MVDNNWNNKAAYEYNCAVHNELIAICNPLLHLGIKNFRYKRIYNNYRYISLGTNLNYLKCYLREIDQPGKFFEPRTIFKEGFIDNSKLCHFKWPNHYQTQEKDRLYNMLYELDIWHGVTISRASPDYIETWSFTADRASTEMPQFYIKNANVLDCFVLYFDSKIKNIIMNMPKSAMAKFTTPFDVNVYNDDNVNTQKIFNFFKDLDLSNFPIEGNGLHANLTSKEIECFTHVALGNTAKHVGKILNISGRTVETHLTSVKQKLGAQYKSDIMSIISYEQLLLLRKIFFMKNK